MKIMDTRSRSRSRSRCLASCLSSLSLIGAGFGFSSPAQAQIDPSTLLNVCSGVSLESSAVTGILEPVLNGIVTPLEGTINPILDVVAIIPLVGEVLPPLDIGLAALISDANDGDPITLHAIAEDGSIIDPANGCNAAADSFTLTNPAGIAIGGNRVTGLGANGEEAMAGEIDSVAIGNRAATDASAADAIAIGSDASVGANATGSMALGSGASATAANSVALGAGSVAGRGPQLDYAAFGLTTPQDSAGEVSVGSVGSERQITNVAPGSAPTDAVNVAQLNAVADQIAAGDANAVQYDDGSQTTVTLAGAGGTTVANVADGELSATSTEAVNGSQLYATNQAVAANTAAIADNTAAIADNSAAIANLGTAVTVNETAITNLATSVANGGIGPVQYSNPDSPTAPNGGTPTNHLALVGADSGPVALHNVADGAIAPGSTDAVNGGQLYALSFAAVNAVLYEVDENGDRTNTIVLTGGDPDAPVTISNVAPATLSATSTQAVNGSQLYATNRAVAAAQDTADEALALGQNSVQYDNGGHTSVTFGNSGTPVRLRNVAAGISPTDAVNVAQLDSAIDGAVSLANAYTDMRIESFAFDLRRIRRSANAGSAAALAAAGLPQAYEPGRGMVAIGFGTYRDQSAVAIGASTALRDGRTVMKLGLIYDSSDHFAGNAGVGWQF